MGELQRGMFCFCFGVFFLFLFSFFSFGMIIILGHSHSCCKRINSLIPHHQDTETKQTRPILASFVHIYCACSFRLLISLRTLNDYTRIHRTKAAFVNCVSVLSILLIYRKYSVHGWCTLFILFETTYLVMLQS